MRLFSRSLLVAVLGVLPAVSLFAQDVTVGDPVWALTADPAPDELSKRGRIHPEFPDEMRKATEAGYVILHRFVDATGKARTVNMVGTEVAYERAVHEALRGNELTQAKRGGKPVDTRVWIPVIFNLKSASAKGPDATPRLLAVTPVVVHDRPAPAGQPPVVRMRLSLDATGAITAAVPDGGAEIKSSLLDEIREGLNAWHFAPARKGGVPVAAEMIVPVICQPAPKSETSKFVPARAISKEPPEFPFAMRRFGISGEVKLDFEIDAEGKVVNPVIVESDSPPFDQPALDAVLKRKFLPATRDGKPVKSKLQLSIAFNPDRGSTGNGIVQFGGDTDQSKLPPELRYDTPAKWRGVTLPVYPLEARQAGARGKAAVAIMINPQGRVSHVSVLSADRPEFGLALTAAAEGFRFEPAYKNGKPVPHVVKFEQYFDDMALADEEGDHLMNLEKKHPERIVAADKLDAPLTPRSRRSPVFPVEVAPGVMAGQALIEFLIDTEGHARLPRVISASEPAFGYSGMQAVGTWLFNPPLAGGKSVVTRVRVPLSFEATRANPPPKPETK